MRYYKNNILGALGAVFALMTAQHALADTTSTTAEKPRTANELTQRYYNTTSTCDSDAPAYMCSGVMLRVLGGYSDKYHAWDPSPFSVTSGATSFSYLRQDSKFGKLAFGYNSGLILYPQQQAPQGTIKVTAKCYFPIDSDTALRSDSGCAEHSAYPDSSASCDQYGITTADAWYSHYTSVTDSRRRHECGFYLDERVANAQARDNFYLALQSQQKLGSEGFSTQNEFRLTTWAANIPGQLPIQAFFYLANSEGLNNAQMYQKDYFNSTGKFVPVVQLTLPASMDQNAKFRFIPADQAVDSDAATS
ncbi:hypothetical protein [Zymobacter palmae]|nr:hypothetical protein [Zymobacter palmae]